MLSPFILRNADLDLLSLDEALRSGPSRTGTLQCNVASTSSHQPPPLGARGVPLFVKSSLPPSTTRLSTEERYVETFRAPEKSEDDPTLYPDSHDDTCFIPSPSTICPVCASYQRGEQLPLSSAPNLCRGNSDYGNPYSEHGPHPPDGDTMPPETLGACALRTSSLNSTIEYALEFQHPELNIAESKIISDDI